MTADRGRRIGSTVAALAVGMVLLAGCRGGTDVAATGSGDQPGSRNSTSSSADADPIGSIEATIDSVESGFATDSTAGR